MRSKLRPAALMAYLAITGRILIMPLVLIMFATSTKYLKQGSMFIQAEESYFAYSQQDAVMIGGCINCNIGCRKGFMQILDFGNSAIISKQTWNNLFVPDRVWNESVLTEEMRELADAIDDDPVAVCMSGPNEWGSHTSGIVGHPQFIVDTIRVLGLSVPLEQLQEVQNAVHTVDKCPTKWMLHYIVRLFKFQAVANSADYSSLPVADFNIFPEYTECRGYVDPDGLIGSKLALDTRGVDLLAVVPEDLTLFPYNLKTSLREVSHVVAATNTIYDAPSVTQPYFRGYYGGCRVREVNTSGVFIEETCTVNPRWETYGLLMQAPDDIPVCSTTDVCVHNMYNSVWEFVEGNDTTKADRFWMNVNVFRSRYTDTVPVSVLPGIIVLQLLIMGATSLYQTMSHKRSVLLTQIWAYKCQSGHMQVMYLAQVTYHLAVNSDLYYLGLTTGTLSFESIGNLTMCFFAFSYSFVNLTKARSGKQQLDRFFRLAWEVTHLFTTSVVGFMLFKHRWTSITEIMDTNGELLRKSSERGARYCNLSDSCIVFTINLVVVMVALALVVGIIPFSISFMLRFFKEIKEQKQKRRVMNHLEGSTSTGKALDSNANLVEWSACPRHNEQKVDPRGLTSFERHCLGDPLSKFFSDCDDIAYVMCENVRASSVEAVLLSGFLFFGENVYQSPSVLLLLMARLLPRSLLRSFNVLLIRWHLDPRTGCVGFPSSCTWYMASGEKHKLSTAVPIK